LGTAPNSSEQKQALLTFGVSGVRRLAVGFRSACGKIPIYCKRDRAERHFIQTDHLSIFAESDTAADTYDGQQVSNEFSLSRGLRDQFPEKPANMPHGGTHLGLKGAPGGTVGS
jgi:hypothetical protein